MQESCRSCQRLPSSIKSDSMSSVLSCPQPSFNQTQPLFQQPSVVSIALPPDVVGGPALERRSRRRACRVCIAVAASCPPSRTSAAAAFMRALTRTFYTVPQLLYPPDELLALSTDLLNMPHPDGFPASCAQPAQRVLPRLLRLPQRYGRNHPCAVVPDVSHRLGSDAVLRGQAIGVGGMLSVDLDLIYHTRIFSGECHAEDGRLASKQAIQGPGCVYTRTGINLHNVQRGSTLWRKNNLGSIERGGVDQW